MTFDIHAASAPIFVNALRNMSLWLDKAGDLPEATLIEARLAPGMKPLPAQYQMASDSAKNAVARLTGRDAPAMADDEATFAQLKDRCARTVAYVESVDADAYQGADTREVIMKFPNGMGYRSDGAAYLTGFALPNFFFHVTTAYAILRAQGVPLGKPDFLQHLGQPNWAA